MKRPVLFSLFIFSLGLIFWPLNFSRAEDVSQRVYPKLANYFLHWEVSDNEVADLAKWDVLILDMEVQVNSRPQLERIRQLNPKIIILAYLSSQEIMNEPSYLDSNSMRAKLLNNIYSGWWLKDRSLSKISFWPGTAMLNLSDGSSLSGLGQRFNDYLPEFVNQEIKSSGLWDGIFYDNLWGDVCWLKDRNVDLNDDGATLNCDQINKAWSDGVKKMLSRSRALFGEKFIISGNGQAYYPYFTYLNGLMLESFPASWENNGAWLSSINNYFNLDSNVTRTPQINIINRNLGAENNYSSLRYGLASALLGNAYFSADRSVADHGQTWWFDEYNINLGEPRSKAYRLFSTSTDVKAGLWRRDFAYGLSLLNSSVKAQKVIFSKEELERIKGTQDPKVNNGERVNWLSLAPGEGIILLKAGSEIINSSFNNGNFVRVYDDKAQTVRNGFFSYLPSFSGDQEILTIDINNDGQLENIISRNGKLEIYRQGKIFKSFSPYGTKYKGKLTFAYDNNNLIINAGNQIQIFDLNFKLLGIFSIVKSSNITMAAGGGKIIIGSSDPKLRIYNQKGKLEGEILAYDSKWRGGVNVAIGDVNNDGLNEIITGPGKGSSPILKIFALDGKLLSQFMAFESNYKQGIMPSVSDVNRDGSLEILVGIKNF